VAFSSVLSSLRNWFLIFLVPSQYSWDKFIYNCSYSVFLEQKYALLGFIHRKHLRYRCWSIWTDTDRVVFLSVFSLIQQLVHFLVKHSPPTWLQQAHSNTSEDFWLLEVTLVPDTSSALPVWFNNDKMWANPTLRVRVMFFFSFLKWRCSSSFELPINRFEHWVMHIGCLFPVLPDEIMTWAQLLPTAWLCMAAAALLSLSVSTQVYEWKDRGLNKNVITILTFI